ncbi:MAG: hypothetical protein QME68_08995, partial [Elusimicrobiota bacterium]|nr:hypothetical protein [Elusimicrobiota bacterium]
MKVSALIPSEKMKYGVKLYEIGYVEVPLDLVIQNFIVNWDSVTEDSDLPEKFDRFQIHNLKLRSKENSTKGILCYESMDGLANFLVEEYIPTNNSLIDHLLKMTIKLNINKRQKKNFLLEAL